MARPGIPSRCRGRPDPLRSRRRVQSVHGTAWPGGPRGHLGTQVPDAQEERPVALHRGGERFNDLGGLEALKAFCRRALRHRADSDCAAWPRGMLLLSPPGCGKSAIAKALGNELGRPTHHSRRRRLDGFPSWPNRAKHSPSPQDRRRHGARVLIADECDKALSGVAPAARPTRAFRPDCSARCSPGSMTTRPTSSSSPP